jgi:hypothetical protein
VLYNSGKIGVAFNLINNLIMTEEQMKIEQLKLTVDSLNNKIDKLSNDLGGNKKPEKEVSKLETWIKNLSLLLGIPGIIVALIFQLSQTKGSAALTEKTLAETEQIKINTLKQKTDIVLDSLINLKTQNLQEYKTIINSELPKLRETISQLEKVNIQRQNQNTVFKYIVVYIVFVGVGFFFSMVSTFWSSLLGVLMRFIYKKTQDSYKHKGQKRLKNFAEIGLYVLGPLPTILELFVGLSLFIALLIPLFNETAVLLGSNTNFSDVFENVKSWNFSEAVKQIREILFK